MRKSFSKASIKIMLLILLSASLIILLIFAGVSQRGSGIRFTDAEAIQTANLFKLAKVWGFAKYRHPSVTAGQLDWDAELFRVMPQVLDAKSSEEANGVIFEWLEEFSFELPQLSAEILQLKEEQEKNIILQADLSWTKDRDMLGDDLSGYLGRLSEITVTETSKGYASFPDESIFVSMAAEKEYSQMKFDDTGMRLLGLFRYWNIIEYFYPYKDIIGEDWDSVLMELLPKFASGQDKQSYVLAVAELSTHIHDSHAYVSTDDNALYGYFGRQKPSVEFANVDGKIVISAIMEHDKNNADSLQLGDVVLSMDGISIEDRIKHCKKYVSLSNDDRFAKTFRYFLLGTHKSSAEVEVLRDNKPLRLNVICRPNQFGLSGENPSGLMEDGQIGYINPAKLAKGELDKLMAQFRETKGLIVDLRNYPSDFIVYTLAQYLIPSSTPFAKFGDCNQLTPGEFLLIPPYSSGRIGQEELNSKPLYQNRVVLLMDETSLSQSEFTIMSLRNAPNAIVLGTPSIGADGNVVEIRLPGKVITAMTGISVFYPDGRQTQRVGLEPDIYFAPTIEDIKSGRDALLEQAVALIQKPL